MIIGLNYTNAKTIDDLNDQMCKMIKEISFLTTGNIDAENIRANSITADLITAGAITTVAIADGSISNAKLADGTIQAGKIADSAITGAKIADAVISNAKLIDSTIQGIKLAAGTLTATQLADYAVTAAKIANNTITASQIANNTITASLIADLTITGSKIANTTISGNKIVTGSITANEIAAGTILATNIASGTITGTQIAAGTITAGKLSVSTLSAIAADLGTITAGSISGITITGGTVRTSASGPRLQMSSDSLNVYDNTGSRLSINAYSATTTSGASVDYQTAGTTVASLYTASNDLKLETTASSNMNIRITPGGSGKIYIPFSNTLDTGGTSLTSYFAPAVHTHSWSAITSGKPTTLSGYGITDAVNTSDVVTTATANKILKLNGSAQLPADITGNAATATTASAVAWSGITSKPTTISGYAITNAYTKTECDNRFGASLVYNPTTKLLKLFAPDGTQLGSSVDISGS